MIKIKPSKICPICHIIFYKPANYAYSTWNATINCSRVCADRARIGKTLPPERVRNIALGKMGSKNPAWRGGVGESEKILIRTDKITLTRREYNYRHKWVKKHKIKPPSCQDCGAIYLRLEAANISGEYKYDIYDYIYLCKKCHNRFDNVKVHDNFKYASIGRINGEKQKNAAREAQLKRWAKWRIDNNK